jgi:hypothetical protein
MLINSDDSDNGFCDSSGEPDDAPDCDAEAFNFISVAFAVAAVLLW